MYKLQFLSYLFLLTSIFPVNVIWSGDTLYFSGDHISKTRSTDCQAYTLSDSLVMNGYVNFYYLESGYAFAKVQRNKNDFTGSFTAYHQTGQVMQQGNIKKGKLTGEHLFYDVSGVLVKGEYYHRRKGLVGQYYISPKDKKVFTIADRLASFGKKTNELKSTIEMGDFINDYIDIPKEADNYGDPTVVVHFLISPVGEIQDINVTRAVHPDLDREAIRVIKSMPAWKPAKFKGEYVYSEMSVAIRF